MRWRRRAPRCCGRAPDRTTSCAPSCTRGSCSTRSAATRPSWARRRFAASTRTAAAWSSPCATSRRACSGTWSSTEWRPATSTPPTPPRPSAPSSRWAPPLPPGTAPAATSRPTRWGTATRRWHWASSMRLPLTRQQRQTQLRHQTRPHPQETNPMTDTALRGMPVRPDVESLDLRPSAKALELREALVAFMHERVFPAEAEYEAHRAQHGPDDHSVPPIVEELKADAKARGLWNLFLPAESGLSQLDYAGLAEITGWSLH